MQIYQLVGSAVDFIVPASGTIWLGPNDDGFDDNSGEIWIKTSR